MAATVILPTVFDPIVDQPRIDNIGGATDNANGNKFLNRKGTRLYLKNPTAGSITATVKASSATVSPANGDYGDVPNPDMVVVLPAGAIFEIACPPGRFNDASGYTTVEYSGAGLLALVLREEV